MLLLIQSPYSTGWLSLHGRDCIHVPQPKCMALVQCAPTCSAWTPQWYGGKAVSCARVS